MIPHPTTFGDADDLKPSSILSTKNKQQSSISCSGRDKKMFRPFDIRVSTEQYNRIVSDDSSVDSVGGSDISLNHSNSVIDTAELSMTDRDQLFFGAYGHLRKKLDYSYHSYYRKERQWLHDSIIEDFLEYQDNDNILEYRNDNGTQSTTINETGFCPWLILAVGVQGAGKHYTFNNLVRSKRLRLRSFVNVAPGMYHFYLLFTYVQFRHDDTKLHISFIVLVLVPNL
jgi:hypothetical protein